MPPLEDWPRQPGTARTERIVDAVVRKDFEHAWCPIELSDETNVLEVWVSCDALRIDGVRVNVDAKTQQRIADEIGGLLLTPKLVDEIYRKTSGANRSMRPRTQPWGPGMSSTDTMVKHSGDVDAEVSRTGASSPPPLAVVGKDWVLTGELFTEKARKRNAAANYGWLATAADLKTIMGKDYRPETSVTGLPLIQSVGTTHPTSHTDYSQIGRFARRGARLNGENVDLGDIYTGKLAELVTVDGPLAARAEQPVTSLVSHEGPLPAARLPEDDDLVTEPPPVTVARVAGLPTDERTLAIFARVARDLRIPPDFLAAVISFESGWDPAISNPESRCTGLIQFCKAARDMLGVSIADLKAMTVAQQLPLVERFYREQGARVLSASRKSVGDAYLAVFAPARVGLPDDATVYQKPSQNYADNEPLDKDGDGRITVAEATAPVRAVLAKATERLELPPPAERRKPGGGIILAVVGIAAALLAVLKLRRPAPA